jgi:phosphate transport system substrate-binding protein
VLARRLFFYLPEVIATPMAKDFVEFAISDEGQQQARQVGFTSQELIAGEVELDESAPEEYRKLTAEAKRLSLNFRFLPGTPKLDNKAQRDVGRLKSYMSQQENSKRELMLFGFADSNESMPIISLQLSTERADTVADLLIKQGLRPGKVRGYGNAVAVGSNDTEAGRSKNRRVEVWVR